MTSTSGQGAAPLPDALSGHAGYLAVLLGQRAQREFEAAILPLDLKPSAYDFLATVDELGALSQRELADVLGIDAARVVAMTDQLEARGLVSRTVDPADRRRNQIALTRAGRALTAKVRRIADRVETELLGPLSHAERVTLRSLMRRVLGLDRTA